MSQASLAYERCRQFLFKRAERMATFRARRKQQRDRVGELWTGLEPMEGRIMLAAVSWDGGGTTNNWSDAANWSNNLVPGKNDNVQINPFETSFVEVIENDTAGFSVQNAMTWEQDQPAGGAREEVAGSGANSVLWQFTLPKAGRYRVSVSFEDQADRVTDAQYIVRNGAGIAAPEIVPIGQVATPRINQELTADDRQDLLDPDDIESGLIRWEDLGEFVTTGTALTVQLTDDSADAGEFISAANVRVELIKTEQVVVNSDVGRIRSLKAFAPVVIDSGGELEVTNLNSFGKGAFFTDTLTINGGTLDALFVGVEVSDETNPTSFNLNGGDIIGNVSVHGTFSSHATVTIGDAYTDTGFPDQITFRGGFSTLVGDVKANQTVIVQAQDNVGVGLVNAELFLRPGFENDGTVRLTSTADKAATLNMGVNDIVNRGTIEALAGAGGDRQVIGTGTVTNEGLISAGAGEVFKIEGINFGTPEMPDWTPITFAPQGGTQTGDVILNHALVDLSGVAAMDPVSEIILVGSDNALAPGTATIPAEVTLRILGTELPPTGMENPPLGDPGPDAFSHALFELTEAVTTNLGTIILDSRDLDDAQNVTGLIGSSTLTFGDDGMDQRQLINGATGLIQVLTGDGGARELRGTGTFTNQGTLTVENTTYMTISGVNQGTADSPNWARITYDVDGGTIQSPAYLIHSMFTVTSAPAMASEVRFAGSDNQVIGTNIPADLTLIVQGAEIPPAIDFRPTEFDPMTGAPISKVTQYAGLGDTQNTDTDGNPIPVFDHADGGRTLEITGDAWQKFAFDAPVTVSADTILEFDFFSATQGEVHGIGFDNNDIIDDAGTHSFLLYGTGTGVPPLVSPNTDFHDYDDAMEAPSAKRYTIPIGTFFTGDFDFLTFFSGDSVSDAAQSGFSNVRIFDPDDPISGPDALSHATLEFTQEVTTLDGTIVLRSEDIDDSQLLTSTQTAGLLLGTNQLIVEPTGVIQVDGGISTREIRGTESGGDHGRLTNRGTINIDLGTFLTISGTNEGTRDNPDWRQVEYEVDGGQIVENSGRGYLIHTRVIETSAPSPTDLRLAGFNTTLVGDNLPNVNLIVDGRPSTDFDVDAFSNAVLMLEAGQTQTNQGTITLTSSGTFNVASSNLDLNGGTLINEGTIDALEGAGADRFIKNGAFQNAATGILNIETNLEFVFDTALADDDNPLAFQAEGLSSSDIINLDPDTRWLTELVSGAFGQSGSVFKASGTVPADPQTTNVLSYMVDFDTAGTYTLYYRGRGFAGDQTNFLTPTDFGVNPTASTPTTTDGGALDWGTAANTFTVVTPGVHELRIGMEDPNVELDAFFFSTDDMLSDAALDANFGTGFGTSAHTNAGTIHLHGDPDAGAGETAIDFTGIALSAYTPPVVDNTGIPAEEQYTPAPDDDDTVMVSGTSLTFASTDGWLKADIPNFDLTLNTILEFDFTSTGPEGAIHGIGFDDDGAFDNNPGINFGEGFQIFGTNREDQVRASRFFNDYDNKAEFPDLGTTKTYVVPIGQFLTGVFDSEVDFLTFMHTADSGTVTFDNIKIYEGPPTLGLRGGSFTNQTGGEVIGNGSVRLTGETIEFDNTGGTVSPGDPGAAGRLVIRGTLNQTGTGQVDIDLGSNVAGSGYDQLLIIGEANLTAGTNVNVSQINSFTPQANDVFEVMKFDSSSGNEPTVVIPAEFPTLVDSYRHFDHDLLLASSAISEPGGEDPGLWDGGGDGFTWDDPLNWTTDTLPTPDDDVQLNPIPTDTNNTVIEAGDAGYSDTMGWAAPVDGATSVTAGDGSEVATWTFTGLTAGLYQVSATWLANATNATDTPFSIFDGGTLLATIDINQESAPADFSTNDAGDILPVGDPGVTLTWETLGLFNVTGTTLTVELSDDSADVGQLLIAAGIHLAEVPTIVIDATPPAGDEGRTIHSLKAFRPILINGGTLTVTDGAVFGGLDVGAVFSQSLTIDNGGVLTPPTEGANFSADPPPHTQGAGPTNTATNPVLLNLLSGEIDGQIVLSGTENAPATVRIDDMYTPVGTDDIVVRGSFNFLDGDIKAGQTLTIQGTEVAEQQGMPDNPNADALSHATLILAGDATNNGTIVLTAQDSDSMTVAPYGLASANLDLGGWTLTNNSVIDAVAGEDAAGGRFIKNGALNNAAGGTVNVHTNLEFAYDAPFTVPGADFAFEAEVRGGFEDLDMDGNQWQVAASTDNGADVSGQVIQAPAGLTTDNVSEGLVTYEFVFTQAGDYTLYYRARGFSESTRDSIYTPTGFDTNPTVLDTTSTDGAFAWQAAMNTFTVTQDDVDNQTVLELRLGVAGADVEIDRLVLSTTAGLMGPALDAVALAPSAHTNAGTIHLHGDPDAGAGEAAIDFSMETFTGYNGNTTVAPVINGTEFTISSTGNDRELKIDFPYTITPNSILEFDFSSNNDANLHAIGFDDDNMFDTAQAFQLYGTNSEEDIATNRFFNDYEQFTETQGDDTGPTRHYVIPIGQFYSFGDGLTFAAPDVDFLTFMHRGTGQSVFSNVKVYEGSPVLTVRGASFTNLNGGVVSGTGAWNLVGPDFDNEGTVAPGDSAGRLSIKAAGFNQTADGQIDIELGGTEAGTGYDQLLVLGRVSLDGDVNVSAINMFDPTSPADQVFEIIKHENRVGPPPTPNVTGPFISDVSPNLEEFYTRFSLVLADEFVVLSDVVKWDGDAGDNLWSTAANWTTDVVPGLDADVQIEAVRPFVQVITFDGLMGADDPGFEVVSGTWTGSETGNVDPNEPHLFNGTSPGNPAGTGDDMVRWNFTDLAAGTYRVSASWRENANRATDAPYTIYDGDATTGTPLTTVDVNQELAEDDLLAAVDPDSTDATPDKIFWEDLGEFIITGNKLTVELTDDANEFVIAQYVRIERLDPGAADPTIVINTDVGQIKSLKAFAPIRIDAGGALEVVELNDFDLGALFTDTLTLNGGTITGPAAVPGVSEGGIVLAADPVTESFDVTGAGQNVTPYGAEDTGDAAELDSKQTLQLTGNAWKKLFLDAPVVVTAQTILEFDFTSTVEGEVHGLGFDSDDVVDNAGTQAFLLYGTDAGGGTLVSPNTDFRDYAADAPGTKHYKIPVGTFFTGTFEFLTFFNADVTEAAVSEFSNVRVYDPVTLNLNSGTINGDIFVEGKQFLPSAVNLNGFTNPLDIQFTGGFNTLTGDLGAGQTLTVLGTGTHPEAFGSGAINWVGGGTNAGTIVLDSVRNPSDPFDPDPMDGDPTTVDPDRTAAILNLDGSTLINNGAINLVAGDGGTREFHNGTLQNGTGTIDASAIDLTIGGESDPVGLNLVGGTVSGTILVQGKQFAPATVTLDGAFTAPVDIEFQGAFSTLHGNIASGQTITVLGAGDGTEALGTGLVEWKTGQVNDGTILLDSQLLGNSVNPTSAVLELDEGTLVNNGAITAVAGAGGSRAIQNGIVQNAGTITANVDLGITFEAVPEGDSPLHINAENADSFTGTSWTTAKVPGAFGAGVEVIQAPAPQSFAVYNVLIEEAGTYTLYYRARGADGSSNSILTPTGFGVDADQVADTTADNTFDWGTANGSFVVTANDVLMGPESFELRIGVGEMGTELDALVLDLADNLTDENLDARFTSGTPLNIEAENRDRFVNPFGFPTFWQFVTSPDAFGTSNEVLEVLSPPSGTPADDTYPEYDVIFDTPGDYTLYYRARGLSDSQNSIMTPTGFGIDPTDVAVTSTDNVFRWDAALSTLTVTQANVDNVDTLSFRIGVGEQGTQFDAVVLSLDPALSQSDLDDLFAPPPTLGNTAAHTNTGTVHIVDNGEVMQEDKVTVTIGGASFTNESGGQVTGTGNILLQETIFNNDGSVAPGQSPGTLAFTADTFNQQANGTIDIEIGGTTAGTDYDQITVTGTVNLDGTLTVTLINGFEPVDTDLFDVLTGGTVNGFFDNAPTDGSSLSIDGGQFEVGYDGTGVALSDFVASDPAMILTPADAGFELVDPGDWTATGTPQFFFNSPGDGSELARWTFDVTGNPGVYRVSVSYDHFNNRAIDAPYTVFNGTQRAGLVDVNQQVAANDLQDAGENWEDLGEFFITADMLVVELSDQATGGIVIADSVRVQKVDELFEVIAPSNPPAAGFSIQSGSWNFSAGNNIWSKGPGDGSAITQWQFTDLTPGIYQVSVSYLAFAGRATNSPYTVLDGSKALATVPINQTQSANDFMEDGVSYENLGSFQIDGTTMNVQLSDKANGLVVAGRVRIERIDELFQIVEATDPDFSIQSGDWAPTAGDVFINGAGSGTEVVQWQFDGLDPGIYRVSVTYTPFANRATDAPYTVLDGSNALEIVDINQQVAANSFVENGIAFQDLGNFRITDSTMNVQLSDLANNFVIAGAVRIQRVDDLADIITIDDPGFAIQDPMGAWSLSALGTIWFNGPGSGTEAAEWEFTGLEKGIYRVSVTYEHFSNRATDAPFTVFNGDINLGTVDINQELAPNDFNEKGTNWEDLGEFRITGDTVRVRLTDDANEFVIAKSVRVERIEDLVDVITPTDPPSGGFTIESGTWNFSAGNDIYFNFAGSGNDVAQWEFTDLTPGFYRVSVNYIHSPGRAPDAPYTVFNGMASLGTVDVDQTVAATELVEDGLGYKHLGDMFKITGDTLRVQLSDQANGLVIAGSVRVEHIADLPPSQVIAPTSPPAGGFSIQSGTWNFSAGNQIYFNFAGTGNDVVRWSFTDLTPGVYRVSVSYLHSPGRASDAPYTVSDGMTPLQTVDINQITAPNDFSEDGVNYEDLGSMFEITGTTLNVDLSDDANGLVIAGKVRIERLSDLP